jgi:hypothetical protein
MEAKRMQSCSPAGTSSLASAPPHPAASVSGYMQRQLDAMGANAYGDLDEDDITIYNEVLDDDTDQE